MGEWLGIAMCLTSLEFPQSSLGFVIKQERTQIRAQSKPQH